MEIPAEFQPHRDQIPAWATDDARFRLCFAITRAVAQRDDPLFCKQLYDGDIPTDAPEFDGKVHQLLDP